MRKLNNWIDGYLDYTRDTESATIFHKWVGLSIVASALQKNIHLDLGRIKIYPNLYIVLVAEPGIARKSQAITFGKDIMMQLGFKLSSDAITREALVSELAGATKAQPVKDETCTILPEQKLVSTLSIVSKEFESFLGQKTENRRMIVFLTDLYDAPDEPWVYSTRGRGEESIPPCCLNILGGTTPDSLSSQLPTAAIGGGLTSRIVFVYASKGSKKVPFPTKSKSILELEDSLISDLTVINRMQGKYMFNGEVKENWRSWYNSYNERDPSRLCGDHTFNGWYSRKPVLIQKVALCMAACKRSSIELEWEDFSSAIRFIEEVELKMEHAFTSVGRSDIAEDISRVMGIIEDFGTINEKRLMQLVWRDIDAKKMENIADTLIKSGRVHRDFKQDPIDKNRPIVIYKWLGDQHGK